MAKTENVELTVLCLIQDGDKILLQNRVKKTGRDIHSRVVMSNQGNLLSML
jgi:hypothetical protein